MSEHISLRNFERRAFSTMFQDGLPDIVIGFFVAQFTGAALLSRAGLGDFWSSAVLAPVVLALAAVAWIVRRKVVVPRLGQLKVGTWRKRKLSRGVLGLLVLNTLIFALGVLAAVGLISRGSVLTSLPIPRTGIDLSVFHVGFGLSVLVLFSVSAVVFEVPRCYLYGAMLALAPVAGELLYATVGAPYHGFPVTFGAVAVVIILIGVTRFIRVLRRYPTPGEYLVEDEARDE